MKRQFLILGVLALVCVGLFMFQTVYKVNKLNAKHANFAISTQEIEVANEEAEENTEQPSSKDSTDHKSMSVERMAEIITALDENVVIEEPVMRFEIEGIKLLVVTDKKANRMRIMTPIKTLDGLGQKEIYRLMQANFDSALDARYAIARQHIMAVFIHPLRELEKNEFISGIGQVVNLVKTYGSTYTSGAMTFGGGDSNELHRKLIDELLKKGEDI